MMSRYIYDPAADAPARVAEDHRLGNSGDKTNDLVQELDLWMALHTAVNGAEPVVDHVIEEQGAVDKVP